MSPQWAHPRFGGKGSGIHSVQRVYLCCDKEHPVAAARSTPVVIGVQPRSIRRGSNSNDMSIQFSLLMSNTLLTSVVISILLSMPRQYDTLATMMCFMVLNVGKAGKETHTRREMGNDYETPWITQLRVAAIVHLRCCRYSRKSLGLSLMETWAHSKSWREMGLIRHWKSDISQAITWYTSIQQGELSWDHLFSSMHTSLSLKIQFVKERASL